MVKTMWYLIAVLVLIIYLITHLVFPRMLGGLAFYLVHSLCWFLLALTTLKLSKSRNIRMWRFNNPIVTMSATIAVSQLVAFIFVGILTTFGESPYQHTPLALIINITFFLSTLVGAELSRAYLVKTCGRRKPTLVLGLTALLYATISTSLGRFTTLDLNSPLELTQFLTSVYLPALAQSLLASYLAYLSGPIPAITYRGILTSFEWLCPILPNPSWSIKALVGVMIPTIGFLTIHQSTIPRFIRKHGRVIKIKKTPLLSWTIIAIITVLAVWSSTGLLGFRPSIISSGSMRPTMDVGDIAITVKTTPEAIKTGDIIQYWQEGVMIVHRVVDIQQERGTKFFITKGDANNAPDPDPIHQDLVVGKLAFTIPKLGWASITVKILLSRAYTLFTTNLTYASTTLGITLAASVFGIHRYRNQPLRKLRRRLRR